MQNPSSRPPVALALSLAVVAASLSSIFIRFAQSEASSLVISAYRLSIATLLLTPLLLLRYRSELAALTRKEIRLSLLAGLFLALHFAMWITSLEYTSVASSVVLVQTTPLMVALLSPVLLGEPLTRYLFMGILVASLGSLFVGFSDACGPSGCLAVSNLLQGTAIKGDLLALGGAAAGAGYVIAGRRVRQTVSLVPYIGIAYGAGAVVLILAAVAEGRPMFSFSPPTYLWLLLLAVLPQLFAHSTYNWALRYLTAAALSLVLLAEPVASSILAFFLLDEVPSSARIIGGLLILLGIALGTFQAQTKSPTLSET